MEKDKIPTTKKRTNFLEKYSELSDSETLKEILYTHSLQLEKLENIRSNTSMLVWWLVAIPIAILIIYISLEGLAAL